MSTATRMIAVDNIKERKTINLQVLSAIHIGSREGMLKAVEFVANGGKVYIIDEDRFGVFLKERNLIDGFVQYASNGRLRMGAFLTAIADREKVSLSTILPKISCRIIPGGSSDMTGFRPCIRDAHGQIFIPGTSLKGVFRTALLYKMLNQDEQLTASMQQKAVSGLHGLNEYKKKHYSSVWLQEERLQQFDLPNTQFGPNRDILRCLTVRDAYPVGECRTQVIKLKFLSKRADSKHYWSHQKDWNGQSTDRELELWVEGITAGTFNLELIWDHKLYKQFKKNNEHLPVEGLEDLMDVVEQFNHDLLEKNEKEFYATAKPNLPKHRSTKDILRLLANIPQVDQDAQSLDRWYNSQPGKMFRVGFGSGMLSTTVNLAFDENARQQIRNACGHQRGNDPAPKTRRVWQSTSSQWLPMGWMTIIMDSEIRAAD